MNTNNVYCYDSPTTTLPDDPFVVVACPTSSCGPSSSWSWWSAVVLIIVSVLIGWIAGYKWGTSSSSRPSSTSTATAAAKATASLRNEPMSSSFHKPPPPPSQEEEDDGGIARKEDLLGARIGGDVVEDNHDEHDDDRDDYDDGSMQVLAGALALLAERFNLVVDDYDDENREDPTSSRGEERTVTSSTKNAHHRNKKKVVEYLSPEDMLRTLFPRVVPPRAGQERGGTQKRGRYETEEHASSSSSHTLRRREGKRSPRSCLLTKTLRLDDDDDDYGDNEVVDAVCRDDENDLNDSRAHKPSLLPEPPREPGSTTPQQGRIIDGPLIDAPTTTSGGRQGLTKQHRTNNNSNVNTFLHLLREIQRHSVDTSHPYFFNQLFGATDPVSLAAELVALSVNTSAYTYETAPVFTLLETEVIGALGRLVFGCRSKTDRGESNEEGSGSTDEARISTEYEEEEFDGDGLMLPGGSLSNLTALHVARHHWCLCNGLATTTAAMASCSDGVKECIDDNVESSEETGTFDASDDDSDVEEKKEEENDQHQHHRRRAPPLPSFPRHHLHSNDASGGELTARSDDDGGGDGAAAAATAATRPGGRCRCPRVNKVHSPDASKPDLVAFVSSEAHYSFIKSVSVTGIGASNLVVVDTLSDGRMDVAALDRAIRQVKQEGRVPFFVAATAGSTVRGSFDDIEEIVRVCRSHERDLRGTKIWVHVDGAWGGAALFSDRPDMKSSLLRGLHQADSFTVNPHKMLGAPQQTTAFVTRHKRILHSSNGAGAKYLFDPRKNGATYDLGDASYTCGRRTDAIKFWALWKFHGREGLGRLVEEKADALKQFVLAIQRHDAFMLASEPWPFNVCFFYLPPRIRGMLHDHRIRTDGMDGPVLPDHISRELAKVTVRLKLRLHESGEILLPYQPLSNQKADCFRLVLAGKKCFNESDIQHILCTMDNFGMDL